MFYDILSIMLESNFEAVVLGTIQGIAEWLPVSSEGMIVLAKTVFFNSTSLTKSIELAFFLHLGTLLAALVYFHKDIWQLTNSLLNFRYAPETDKKVISFMFFATLISGALGYGLLQIVEHYEKVFTVTGTGITIFVGAALLFTSFLLYSKQRNTNATAGKTEADLTFKDTLLLGVGQALASIPGISRSGSTTALFLLRDFTPETALRLSFIMSIPLVLGANIILNLDSMTAPNMQLIIALVTAFITGIASIHILLLVTKKTNFALFVLVFGLITIGSAFFGLFN